MPTYGRGALGSVNQALKVVAHGMPVQGKAQEAKHSSGTIPLVVGSQVGCSADDTSETSSEGAN